MIKKIIFFLIFMIVPGCGWLTPEPVVKMQIVEVNVPVAVKATPPPELLAPLHPEIPVFISPSDPEASSCLSDEGEDRQKRITLLLVDHIRAWRVWGR